MVVLIISLIFIYTLFYILNKYLYTNLYNYSNKKFSSKIPKIIHQTAPNDKKKWNKSWYVCQDSWFKYFPEPEYKYMMWYDEDLENLIRNDFTWFYDIYMSYENNIQRIDVARYFILYKYGGIYADMDYMCMKNFYNELPSNKVSISESPYKNNEYLQNALMASDINNNFWIKVINKAIIRKDSKKLKNNILYTTGPKLITDVYYENKNDVNVLDFKLYNPNKDSSDFYNNNVIAKHIGTCSWC